MAESGCAAAPLISTHLMAFGLMPTSMFVFFKRAPRLLAWGADSPITSIIGLSFLMVWKSGHWLTGGYSLGFRVSPASP